MAGEKRDNRAIQIRSHVGMPWFIWLMRKIARDRGVTPQELVSLKAAEKLAEEDAEVAEFLQAWKKTNG